MKCCSKKTRLPDLSLRKAFSLVEVVTALIILALVCSSVLTVYNRCLISTADSALRMQAFEVARENMETLLAVDLVKETAEYGQSDKYPQIQWETTVEAFYEPITERMWIQGVCSAAYTDSAGTEQTVELTHWLTDLTKEQMLQILADEERKKELLAQIIETIEEAAEYAGVDVETIQRWVDNGMPLTEDGYFTKGTLDLYKETNGNPPPEAIRLQAEADEKLIEEIEQPTEQVPVTEKLPGEVDFAEMTPEEIWDYVQSRLSK